MIYRIAAITVLAALAEARFGQEQVPIPAISALNAGAPGEAQTLAGSAVSDILAGANACAKLQKADEIIAQLGNGADVLAAAIGLVAAEKNVNPFNSQTPTVCSDPTLPTTLALRGITPLVDPAFNDSAIANALSAKTKTSPLDATGKSILDLMTENGVVNVAGQDASGNATPAQGSGSAASAQDSSASSASSSSSSAASSAAASDCNSASSASDAAAQPAAASAPAAASQDNSQSSASAASSNGVEQSSIAGLDFGLCVPTIKFEGGLGGRPATEFTFQAIDEKISSIQEEALNPNIITNRICDELTNQCQANQAAKDACTAAKAQISALNTRNKGTADAWNTALGFAGTVTNPDGGPDSPAASASAAGRKVRRSFVA